MIDFKWFTNDGTLVSGDDPRAEILAHLTRMCKEAGRLVTKQEYRLDPDAPAISAINKYCKSFDSALRIVAGRIGVTPPSLPEQPPKPTPPKSILTTKGDTKMGGKRRTDQQLLDDLRALSAKIGAPPTTKDVSAAAARGECANAETYRNRFGNFKAACAKAGIDKTSPAAPSMPAEPEPAPKPEVASIPAPEEPALDIPVLEPVIPEQPESMPEPVPSLMSESAPGPEQTLPEATPVAVSLSPGAPSNPSDPTAFTLHIVITINVPNEP